MILVAAPHARCYDERGTRTKCDGRAGEAAFEIGRALRCLGKPALVLLPQLTRSQCDLNRPLCRATLYRSRLRNLAGGASLVLDVHSFRPHGGRIGRVAGARPFVLLDLCQSQPSATTQSLRTALSARGWPADVICSRVGDIRTEMTELGIPVASIEVSIDLAPRQRFQLYRHIAAWAASRIAS